ncbi:MAG: HAD family phosphatase [Bryobacteraceae bacterium]
MIRTVIFDLGKVLIPFDFTRGYRALEELCGCPAGDIPRRIGATGLVPRFEAGQVGPEDFVRQLCSALEMELDFEKFREIWSCIFLFEPLIPESMIVRLGERYRLLLLSNTNALHFPMLRESFPLLNHFHDYVLSYEVGAMKPSPRIYAEAIARSGCQPDECFFTDDVAEYVEGARRAGMDAVQFQNCAQLQNELLSRGIDWR